jgi:hypothetical protein
MAFYVGQKVVCVDDVNRNHVPDDRDIGYWITRGNIYTIRRVSMRKLHLVWLNGINRARIENGITWGDTGFYAGRFRPVAERKTDISIFKALLNPANHKQLEGV